MLSAHFDERRFLPWHPTGFVALTCNFFLSQLAMGMVGAFGVVYVYQLGDTLAQGLLNVLSFYGLQRIIAMAVVPSIGYLLQKRGHRRVMIISLLFLAAKLTFLVFGQGQIVALVLASVCGGVYLGGYFVGFDGLFLTDGHNKQIGQEYGWLIMLQRIGGMIAPLVGGLLITYLGFESMFLASLLLVIISCWPLWAMKRHTKRERVYESRMVAELVRDHPTVAVEMLLHSVAESVLTFFWPLYLLLAVQGSYSALGGVMSAVAIVSSLGVYMTGRLYDRRPLALVFPYASMITAVMYGLRFGGVGLPILVGATDAVGRFISPLWWMKLRRFEFGFGESHNRIVFSVVQEILSSFGLLLGLMVGVVMLLVTNNWWWIGVMGGVGVLMSSWVMESHELVSEKEVRVRKAEGERLAGNV